MNFVQCSIPWNKKEKQINYLNLLFIYSVKSVVGIQDRRQVLMFLEENNFVDLFSANWVKENIEWISAQKMKFSIKDFVRKCNQIHMPIWSHLLKKSLLENFMFLFCEYAKCAECQ